ncbi:MAG: type IV secretory system conjugative DNA transfer family protein [Actinobacteria bacterium]|nr:type IV secretory system conjugative DNA transfer family protein [Actinomycetota bacterium]
MTSFPANAEDPRCSLRALKSLAQGPIYLGRTSRGYMWTAPERHLLVLGPPGAGKTSCIVIPSILTAPGAVLSTSTKTEIMQDTYRIRNVVGRSFLYDPSGAVPLPSGVQHLRWSPLTRAGDWKHARMIAATMAGMAHLSAGATASTGTARDHWHERAESLLAPLLHAASIDGRPMRDLIKWVDTRTCMEALRILQESQSASPLALDLLTGIASTEERELSGIWSTASGLLGAYRDEAALESTTGEMFDPAAFVRSNDTIYICATGTEQAAYAPLIAGLVASIQDASYTDIAEYTLSTTLGARMPSRPPVLFALDEIANIAPLPQLLSIASEGRGQGIIALVSLQDLSQARNRWGRDNASGFMTLFGTAIVFRGIKDIDTLKAIETLAGEHPVMEHSVSTPLTRQGFLRHLSNATSRNRTPREATQTSSAVMRPVLPADTIARGLPGHAIVIDENAGYSLVETTPYDRCEPFRTAVQQAGRIPAGTTAPLRDKMKDLMDSTELIAGRSTRYTTEIDRNGRNSRGGLER